LLLTVDKRRRARRPSAGRTRRGGAFLASHLHHDRGITALDGAGRVVGVAGYKLAVRALTGGTARDVLSVYGLLRGLPRLALLALFTRKPAEGELDAWRGVAGRTPVGEPSRVRWRLWCAPGVAEGD
ncbi:hypothetical protein, partial [Actinomadura formosensis]|uniref:hypothetical protein n=1 Tax=Actinomadura formosensis TaxID=60706 RepID=UPI000AE50FFD